MRPVRPRSWPGAALLCVAWFGCSQGGPGPAPEVRPDVAPVEGPPIQKGLASFYADRFTGRPTASGVPYNPRLPTCAHKKLKFGTEVEVLRLSNRKRARCVVNDRGPFSKKKIIDLSRSVASALDIEGVAQVELRRVPDEARQLPPLHRPQEPR